MLADATRRSLLRASALVAGTLVFTQRRGQLWAQTTGPYDVANCDVVTASNADIYCVDSDGKPVALPIDQKSNIWKGRDGVGLGVIKPGDHIDAQIEVTAAGQRRVKHMWVNLNNVSGVVSRLTPDGFELLINHGVGAPGGVLPILVGDNAVVNNGLVTRAAIAAGLNVQVIGLGLPGGTFGVRQLLATTILLHNKFGVMVGAEHLPIRKGSAQ